ncbi:MAG: hypothetical protein J6D54_06915, partial [Olsenella sp.]|nr:hypothetical protein [Olsenella sp.]
MAEMTKQANFRLSVAHIEIIGKLAAMGRMTKASVVERALELLERRVAEGEHIPETPPSAETRQANFRLRVRHVEIINDLAAREYVTKATVVERALELLDEEMGGGATPSPSHAAPAITTGPILGNTAVDLSVVETQRPSVPKHAIPSVLPLHEVRPAASLEEPSAAAVAAPVVPVPPVVTDVEAEELARKNAAEERRRKAREEKELRERLRAEAEKEAEEKIRKAIEEMRVSL